jgi:glucose-1-phosphate cytidylyltransferase
MKTLILAGGYGSRLSEETELRPKPMVEISGRPILWHIMKIYSHYGFNEFVILLGYKGYQIKEYFYNYFLHQSDITIDLENNKVDIHKSKAEPWKITLVDTGLNTMTAGRIKKVRDYIGDETFMLTYGDGVADIDIKELISSHKKSKKFATVTAVQPLGRFGTLNITDGEVVSSFYEKPKGDNAWINGGFFVLEPEIFNYIKNENTLWEKEPMETLARQSQLNAYRHRGFWRPMDTLRDKTDLENLWNEGNAPWRIWE